MHRLCREKPVWPADMETVIYFLFLHSDMRLQNNSMQMMIQRLPGDQHEELFLCKVMPVNCSLRLHSFNLYLNLEKSLRPNSHNITFWPCCAAIGKLQRVLKKFQFEWIDPFWVSSLVVSVMKYILSNSKYCHNHIQDLQPWFQKSWDALVLSTLCVAGIKTRFIHSFNL